MGTTYPLSDPFGTGGVGGALEFIENFVIADSAKSEFPEHTPLDINTDGAYMIVLIAKAGASGGNFKLLCNDNTGNIDTTVAHYVDASLNGMLAAATAAEFAVPFIGVSTTSDEVVSQTMIYRSQGGFACFINDAIRFDANPFGYSHKVIRDFDTITNITKLQVASDQANDIQIGSEVRLYKLKKS